MPAIAHNVKLNDLAVDLGRSLLQYAAETDAWTADGGAARSWKATARTPASRPVRLCGFMSAPIRLSTIDWISIVWAITEATVGD